MNGTNGLVNTLQAVEHGTNVAIGIVSPSADVWFLLFDTISQSSIVLTQVEPGLKSGSFVAPIIVQGRPCLALQDDGQFYGFKARNGVFKCSSDSEGVAWSSANTVDMTPHFGQSAGQSFLNPMVRKDAQGRLYAISRDSYNYWVTYCFTDDTTGMAANWTSMYLTPPQVRFLI